MLLCLLRGHCELLFWQTHVDELPKTTETNITNCKSRFVLKHRQLGRGITELGLVWSSVLRALSCIYKCVLKFKFSFPARGKMIQLKKFKIRYKHHCRSTERVRQCPRTVLWCLLYKIFACFNVAQELKSENGNELSTGSTDNMASKGETQTVTSKREDQDSGLSTASEG